VLVNIRDIAIILLALESLVIGVLLALMLAQLRKLVRLLREEIGPLLDTANETAHTVRGTVGLVSETLVQPLIKVRSYTAGARQVVRNLAFIGRKVRSSDKTDDSAAKKEDS